MQVVVQYSGGKDSQASLLWAVNKWGCENVVAVFCNTKWEYEETYSHLKQTCEDLNVELIYLKSKKYDGMVDLATKKKRFASTTARFCTEELKIKPLIDWVLQQKEHLLFVQGIRKNESAKRSKQQQNCRQFRHYFEPYYTKTGKAKYFTYRKKEVIEWCSKYDDSVIRPMFLKTGKQVIDYILENGQTPNILYYKGAKRVGCKICVNSSLDDIKAIMEYNPQVLQEVAELEKELDSSFFTTNKIPAKYCSKTDKNGKKYPVMQDIINYKTEFTIDMFPNETGCASHYNLCEI